MAPIGTLTDTFAQLGTGWVVNGAGAQFSQLYVNCSSNAGAPVYSSARRAEGWTWSGSAVSMYGVVMPAEVGDTANAQLWMMDPAPANTVDRLGFEYIAATNTLVLRGQTGATYAPIGTDVNLTYDPVAHRNLRLTHTGTNVVWATSPDGLTWTTRRTLTTPPTWTTKTTLTPSFEAFRSTGVNDTLRLAAVNVAPPALPTSAPTALDALQDRTLAELRAWEAWLSANGARGWVGEFGWVTLASHYGDTGQGTLWAALGEVYETELDYAGLSGTVWASGREWGQGYPLGVHVGANAGDPLTIANTDADGVVTAHPTRGTGAATRWRGVSLSGWEQGIAISGGGTVRSTPGYVHTFDDFGFLAARGVDTVRLPVAWERLQPTLSAALDTTALNTLDGMISAARRVGIRVVIDLHNYGRYTQADGSVAVLGSSGLSNAAFSDFWTRLSTWVKADATRSGTVIGYGLMNEPHDLPGGAPTWETSSQAALTAIRNNADARLILVAGYAYSSLTEWATWHPDGWITDPSADYCYEAHHYWDTRSVLGSRSGTYQQDDGEGGTQILTYATELDAADGSRGLAFSSGLRGVVTKTYLAVGVASTGGSVGLHGTETKRWPGIIAVARSDAFGGFIAPTITDAQFAEAEARSGRWPVWNLQVDWTNQDFTGPVSDLTDTVRSITVERETTGELPAEAGLVDGYATGQVTAELGGARPDTDMPLAAELSPYRADSPLYKKTLVTPTCRVDLGLLTDDGPKLYRQLTGPVRSLRVSESEQSVELIAVDPSERIRELITLPTYAEFVTHAARRPWAITVNTQWVVDHVLRRNNIYVSPPPRADAIISCTGHGGLVSEIGFNGAPISIYGTGPQAGLWTEDSHPWGMLGTPENATGGTVGYQEFYGVTDGWNAPFAFQAGYGVGISAWLHIGSYMNLGSSFENRIFQIRPGDILFDNADNEYPRLFVSGFGNGDFYAGLTTADGGLYATPRISTGPERWRFIGVHFQYTSSTQMVVTVRSDATTRTYTIAVPSVAPPHGYRPSLQANGQMFRAWTNLQVWPSYTAPTLAEWQAQEHHVSEADVGRGVNELLYLPDVAATDSWDVLKAVVGAEFGVHGFDPDGRYFFRPRTDARTSDASVDIDVDTNLSDVSYTLSSDSVRNVIGYSSTPRYHSGEFQAVWQAQDALQFICPPGVTQWDLDWPWGVASREGGLLPYYYTDQSVDPPPQPQWSGDLPQGWTYSYGSNWSGEQNIESVVVTWCQVDTRRIRLTVNNTGGTTVRLGTDLNVADPDGEPGDPAVHIGGWPMVDLPAHVAEYRNDDSITRYGTRALGLQDSEWRQTPGALDPVAKSLLGALAEPVPLLEDLPVRGNPQVQVGQIARLQFRGDASQPIYGAIVKTSRTLDESGLVDSISVRPLPLQTLAPEGWSFYVDISDYQAGATPIDLTRVHQLGYAGVVAKIGQGAGTTNDGQTTYGATIADSWTTFRDQARALWPANTAGYWYVGNTETPAAQASRAATALGAGPAQSIYDPNADQVVDRIRTDGPYTLGTEVKLNKTAQLTALRFYRPSTQIGGTIRGRLYRVNSATSGTAISGTDVTFSLSGTGWQTATLSSPVTLPPATYRIAILYPGAFPESDNYFTTGPGADRLDRGIFVVPNQDDAVGQSQSSWVPGGSLAYPQYGGGNGRNWWGDWVVNTTVDQLPVMLDWEDGGGTWTNLQNVKAAFVSAGINVTMLYTSSGYATAAVNGPAANIDALGLNLVRARFWTNDQDNPRTLFDDVEDPAGFYLAPFAGGTPKAAQFTGNGVIYSGMVVDVDAFPGTADELADMFWRR